MMDNFIVSARKYRPSTFVSVVGQQHITSTLKNAIARNQLAHAYLFCGPRGVGKTTCARIFAKAINCTDPRDSEACGECESCRSFAEGRSFSIHELDAASNNSVDDIRSLTEQVRIPPQIGRYSVYIIDEVHMLSQAAFNAFLKTLEEPPAHAVFILATTEKHKIIPTILSRCQIYDFNRIRVEDSVGYLQYIAAEEGVGYDDESLNLIAQKADGGMRDALSMFDKAVAFCGGRLDFREVARTLNVLDYDTYFSVMENIGEGDYKSVLRKFDEVLRAGFSGQTFVAGLSVHLRDLLLCKDPATLPLLEVTGTLMEKYKAQSERFGTAFLFDAVSLLSSVDNSLRMATNQRLHIELGLMKLCGMGQKKNSLEGDPAPLPELSKGNGPAIQTPPLKKAAAAVAKPAEPETPEPTEEAGNGIAGPEKHVAGTPPPKTEPEDKSAVEDGEKHAVKKPSNGSLTGVKINTILRKGSRPDPEDAGAAPAYREEPDPQFAGKLASAKEEFLSALERQRPRFATALREMTAEGNVIHASVGNELLRDDMVQCQREIFDLLRRVSGITGPIELQVEIKEDKTAVRPVKPEDKLNHMRSRNPLIDELRRELGLELE